MFFCFSFNRVHCQLLPIFGNGRENRDLNGKGAFTWSANKVFDIPNARLIGSQFDKSKYSNGKINDQSTDLTNDNGNDENYTLPATTEKSSINYETSSDLVSQV